MIKHPFYSLITTCAIVLSATAVGAEENINSSVQNHATGKIEAESTTVQNISQTTFVCAVSAETPTMYAYNAGNINLKPLISWHPEYLLPEQSGTEICQQTATKLQDLAEQQQERYFRTETKEDKILVCLVTEESETCAAETSEQLFSLNPNYDPGCVLDNREPLECVAIGKVRGVFDVQDSPYSPIWWPW